MISVIAPNELEKAKRTQSMMIGVYVAIAVVVVVANVLIAVLLQPVRSTLACVLNIVLTALFGLGSIFSTNTKRSR